MSVTLNLLNECFFGVSSDDQKLVCEAENQFNLKRSQSFEL